MKEIIFRQYLKKEFQGDNDVFHYWGYVGGAFISPVGKNYTDTESQQFTGLKDANGKRIFEGDILCLEMTAKGGYGLENDGIDKIIGPVEFGEFNPDCCVLSAYLGFHISEGSLRYVLSKKNCRVIGNIHQNSELLVCN